MPSVLSPHCRRCPPSSSSASCSPFCASSSMFPSLLSPSPPLRALLASCSPQALLSPSTRHCLQRARRSLTFRFGRRRYVLRPVLLAGRDGEQRWFGGRRDLDCSAPRVRWLHTPLRGKAEAQGSRPSKPEKKGTRPIGNSRGIAARVGRLLSGSGKALDTFLCPLHESGLVEGRRM